MGNNRDSSFARPQQTRTTWFLLTILPVSLFLFFTMALYHISNLHHAQKNHAASAISEITALIESHKSHLYARDAKAAELEDRSISSFFSGLASTLGSSAKKVAESIASTMGSGVEKAAESAASDLGLGNITSLISGIFSGNKTIIEKVLGHLATPAKFLGMGLAEGGLTGLGMSTSMGTSATGLDKVALNLGSGLTSTIFSSPEVKSMFSDNSRVQDSSNGGLLGGSSGTVGQAVLALSQGLGSGALTGLKLNTASKGSAFDTTGLNGIAGNFGQGLTSTLLGGLDTSLPSLSHSKGDGPGFLALLKREFKTLDSREKRRLSSALVSTISDAALGLGEGLGSGTAVGLGFQNSSEPIRTANGIEGITKNFAYGLSSSFLTDGTLTTLIALLSKNSSFFANANLAQVAQGLAVGVVSGAGSQVSSLQLISANTSAFDDSIHGAATGFGRGIGAEGAKMVSSVFANGLTKELSLKFKKRGAEPAVVHLVGKSSRARLQRPGKRASTITTNATDVASVVTSHNAFKINPFLQTGVNALGCSGVGGFVGVFLGLQGSKTINVKSKFSLPDQLFIVHNAGNTYAVNPSKGVNSATANGFKVATIVLLGGLHIMFAVGAWFVAIPLLLLLSSVDELGLIFPPSYKTSEGAPLPTPITRRYLFWAAIPTFAITGFVFGVVMVGTSAHMRGAHQVGFVSSASRTVEIDQLPDLIPSPPHSDHRLRHYSSQTQHRSLPDVSPIAANNPGAKSDDTFKAIQDLGPDLQRTDFRPFFRRLGNSIDRIRRPEYSLHVHRPRTRHRSRIRGSRNGNNVRKEKKTSIFPH